MQFYNQNPLFGPYQKQQEPTQIVNIDRWHLDGESKPYAEGQRAKVEVFCPTPAQHRFLIPGHRYLFKESLPRYPGEFWSEIAAYELSKIFEVPVPPAFVAQDPLRGHLGVLIEWFYDYPHQRVERYTPGSLTFMRLIPGFDLIKGVQHNLKTLITYANFLHKQGMLRSPDWQSHWLRIFMFDAIIGNTDRHQDNWGIVWGNNMPMFSPAFDNGSSLGREFSIEKLRTLDIKNYIAKGRHHIREKIGDKHGMLHFELVGEFLRRYPYLTDTALRFLNIDRRLVRKALAKLCQFDVAIPMEIERAVFIEQLIFARMDELARTIK